VAAESSVPRLLRGISPSLRSGRSIYATACGRQNWRTALHAGKDLFVAPPPFGRVLPPFLQETAGAVGFRLGRHCSHLYPRGRRALPATCLPILPTGGGCRIEHPEDFARDKPLTSFGTLNFATACGRQNWRMFGLSYPLLFEKGAGRSPGQVRAQYTTLANCEYSRWTKATVRYTRRQYYQ
jgi:hypothetical protein